ncbi:MAG TPA: hypothetical protein VJK48_06150 [Chlamydiales bacterium]|nr:hypothetical protein [Chlamydiales bacterium]
MKGLDTGKDKIQRICDALRKETLEPAHIEAKEIVEKGQAQAQELIAAAKKMAEDLVSEAEKEIAEKRKVFETSLQLACRQGVEKLKSTIEKEIFDQYLSDILAKEMGDPQAIAKILETFFQILREKGIEDEFVIQIPKSVAPRQISALVAGKMVEKLEKGSILLGEFAGGVQIQMQERAITIDISDEAVHEIIAFYIRRDFRELVYKK